MGEASPRVLVHTGWVLPGSITSAASLRNLIAEALPPGCERRDDVELVARELGINAATHSRARTAGGFAAELTVTSTCVELAVHDPGGTGRPRLTRAPDPLVDPELPAEAFEHGRGLVLVDAHADTWGFTGDGNGCTVWACFDLPHPLPETPRSGKARTDRADGESHEVGSDFPGPGGVRQPPENVLAYLLQTN